MSIPFFPRFRLRVIALLAVRFGCWATLTPPAVQADPPGLGWENRLPPHPRLILNPQRLTAIQAAVRQSPQKELYRELYGEGEKLLALPPVVPPRKGGDQAPLVMARAIEQRIVLLAFLAQVSGESRFAEAAIREMKNVAGYQDWVFERQSPRSHVLVVAEISAGFALGYDWLYAQMTPDDRQLIAHAIRQKGLSFIDQHGPQKRAHNATAIVDGSMVLACLAIAEDQPEECTKTLPILIKAIPGVGPCYSVGGSYAEGPSYWAYGTTFLVMTADALQTALGTTCNLEKIPGVLKGARFLEEDTGPSGGRFFMYSDSEEFHHPTACELWVAQQTQDGATWKAAWDLFRQAVQTPSRSAHSTKASSLDRFAPFALIWGIPDPARPFSDQPLPLHWVGDGVTPLATFRTSWGDPTAAFLAIKGSSPSVNHAHMDCGAFTYEWGGIRWADDVGKQDYETLKTGNDDLKWQTFRDGIESHNIITIDDALQELSGNGKLLSNQDEPYPLTSFDLTSLYRKDSVQKVTRAAILLPDGRGILQDHWEIQAGAKPAAVACQFITRATVKQADDGVILTQDNQQVRVKIQSALKPRIKIQRADDLLRSFDPPVPGVTRVQFVYTAAPGQPQDAEMWFCPPGTETKPTAWGK